MYVIIVNYAFLFKVKKTEKYINYGLLTLDIRQFYSTFIKISHTIIFSEKYLTYYSIFMFHSFKEPQEEIFGSNALSLISHGSK